MPPIKISALPTLTTPDAADQLPINDVSANTTKKMTLTVLKEWLQSLAGWITTAMFADASVTSSKVDWSTLGKFSAQRNGALNIGSTATRVAFDTEIYDIGGGFNPATGIFTCPAGMGGYWNISGGIHVSSLASQVLAIDMRKNGTEFARIARIDAASGGWAMYGGSDVLLADGDTIDMIAIVTGTARPLTGGSYQNFITGHQISKT